LTRARSLAFGVWWSTSKSFSPDQWRVEAVALGDASRCGAGVHTVPEPEQAVGGHREDAEVVAGGVGHQQVLSITRQRY
jgi:hypothetical protein